MKQDEKQILEVQVKLKIKDVLRYNMYVAYRSWFNKIILGIGIILCGWMGYQLVTTSKRLDIFISENILMLMLGVFIVVVTPLKVWRITAMQMQSPVFSGTSSYTFSSDAIHIKINDLEDTVSWEIYHSIRETKKDFRFFVDKVQAQIIPKHNMTEKEIVQLRQFIKQALPKERYHIG